MAKGVHKMKVDSVRKVFQIDLSGFYGVDDAEDFFTEYAKHTNSIPKGQYNIVINCKELACFKPDILPYLKDAYKAYGEFKHIQFINPPTASAQGQLKRIAKDAGMINRFVFVDDERQLTFK